MQQCNCKFSNMRNTVFLVLDCNFMSSVACRVSRQSSAVTGETFPQYAITPDKNSKPLYAYLLLYVSRTNYSPSLQSLQSALANKPNNTQKVKSHGQTLEPEEIDAIKLKLC